ncbi:hypothetical protein [Actinoplanes palleronii]|uniref:Uncharacterized protein n=1 Tax=Actinoplanes palleronii TaxID=113570 RepID=A0ABQ4BF20_9ACTN|nr:hypothetical protein [Actinoplanes palleronii]GIE69180.1 hypothetical protein Apa02nite_052880 [Actinoplanes palleronii]
MAGTSANRRNWLVALAAAVLLLILLAMMLSYCDRPAGTTDAGPPGAVASTLPPVTGPGSPGTLSPRSTEPGAGTTEPQPGDSATGNDPTTDPVATSSTKAKASPSHTRATPRGGVDAGGGAGLSGQRTAMLITGVFLLAAAVIAGRYAVGRTTRD